MRHDQKKKVTEFTCSCCREYMCTSCVDVLREKIFGSVERLCVCPHPYLETTDYPDGYTPSDAQKDYLASKKKEVESP